MASLDGPDLFKDDFKRYKKSSSSDLSGVIDFRSPEHFSNDITEISSDDHSAISRFGLRPPQEWRLFSLNSVPGLVVIPNPFQPGSHLHWIAKCLVDYPLKPNVCNLDAHMERSGEGRLWPESCTLLTRQETTPMASGVTLDEEQEEVVSPKRLKLSSSVDGRVGRASDLYRLRWVTLGYHYDWNTKEYYRDRWSPFPAGLGEMATFILKACGFPNFHAESGIVNYYHMDSTLSGHTDHSEKDLSRPLLSLSFGQSAIFLIGGPTKQVRPKALLLNSGDVVVMAGQSRLAYHGVPKILPHYQGARGSSGSRDTKLKESLLPNCLQKGVCEAYLETPSSCDFASMEKGNDSPNSKMCESKGAETGKGGCSSCRELIKAWQLFESYMSTSRININIRQVTSETCAF